MLVESLKVIPYPPTRELAKPHPTAAEGTQVMSVDEGPSIRALTIYRESPNDEFDIDPHNDTSERGLKAIEELARL